MNYTIKNHPTKYAGVLFRSRLEARWAAFFDLLEWKWEYEPIDLEGWTPDFILHQPCGHSECMGGHELYCEVKPYNAIERFEGHPAYNRGCSINTCCLGLNPNVTQQECIHGHGGIICEMIDFIYQPKHTINELWLEAGNKTQWNPDTPEKRMKEYLKLIGKT